MADYISREAVMELRPKNIEIIDSSAYIELDELLDLVGEIPAADVEPVRHGWWEGYTHSCYCGIDQCGDPIFREKPVYYCSNPKCRRKTVVKENFCPSCGAKMDLMDLEVENHG